MTIILKIFIEKVADIYDKDLEKRLNRRCQFQTDRNLIILWILSSNFRNISEKRNQMWHQYSTNGQL